MSPEYGIGAGASAARSSALTKNLCTNANATSSFASFSSDPLNIVPLSVLFDIDRLLLSFPAFSAPDHQSIHLLEQSLVITHDILHLTVLCDDLIIERK